jgi:hypothetical protein
MDEELIVCWIVNVKWLDVVLKKELRRLDNYVNSVDEGSKGVKEEIKK